MVADLRWQFFANLGGQGAAWALMEWAPDGKGWLILDGWVDRV